MIRNNTYRIHRNSTIGRLPLRNFEMVSEVPNSTVALTASAMALRGSSGSMRAYSETVRRVRAMDDRHRVRTQPNASILA